MIIHFHGTSQEGRTIPTPVDSVSVIPTLLKFDEAGDPYINDYTTITSSGTWSAAKVDTGDGTSWFSIFPTSGSTGETCTVTVNFNSGVARSASVSFTVGTATAYLTITQDKNPA